MGYPLRFFGTGRAVTVDGVRLPAQATVEICVEAFQGIALFRPDDAFNSMLLSCLGRAHSRHPTLQLHAVSATCETIRILATPTGADVLSAFMRDFLSTFAVRCNRLRRRRGPVVKRRYIAVALVDDESIIGALWNCLSAPCDEGWVWSPRHWNGVNLIDAFEHDASVGTTWTPAVRGHSGGPTVERYSLSLVPIPPWRHLRPAERQRRASSMLDDIATETRLQHLCLGTRPVGFSAATACDAHSRAKKSRFRVTRWVRSPKRSEARRAFLKLYRRYQEQFRASARAIDRSTSARQCAIEKVSALVEAAPKTVAPEAASDEALATRKSKT